MKAYCLKLCTCIALLTSSLLIHHCGNTQGAVTISLDGMASVCRGDPLGLICMITDPGSFSFAVLQWNITLTPEQDTTSPMSYDPRVSSTSPSNQRQQIMENSINFTLLRVSPQNEFPLVSRLLINPVTRDLNVRCRNDLTSELSNVVVVNATNGHPIQDKERINLTEKYFEKDGVSITLEWTQTDSTYSYHVAVVPDLPLNFSISTRVHIKIPYNSPYNISVEVSSCRQYNATTFHKEVLYSKCGILTLIDDRISFDFVEPAIENSIVTFVCPGELIVNGFNTLTCRNGEWEPDPRNLHCSINCHSPSPPPNGYILPYTNTFEGAMVTYVCWNIHRNGLCGEVNKTAVCTKNGQWEPSADNVCAQPKGTALSQGGIIAVASSVFVLIISSVAFFIFGYFCGHYRKVQEQNLSSPVTRTPVYEDVLPQHHTQDLELKSNVAYAQTMTQ